MNLNQKHEAATKAHQIAMVELERAGLAYGEVEPTYAGLKGKSDELQQAKQEQLDAMAAAKERLTAAMLTTMGRMSDDVKEALAARRTADDLVDQFNELETIVASQFPGVRVEVSLAARNYLHAYDRAVATWAEMNALGVLAECGERLALAMAVRMRGVPNPVAEDLEDRRHVRCRSFVLRELERLCENYGYSPTPYEDLIPVPHLGKFSEAEILSPAQIAQLKAQLAAAT
ncbi:hypothetical protein GM658_09040 [Pseudoduganella eburnea]|uniref:Uncharacterized protein n=1 Tax=Massilia eburnea TaxID=1776165 RepID=A0A6L6QE01_9BURK|nr:hypothetical protein [Massilia eburnea]MTW10748.1 hypothetical protein [Massilia eburnea]